MIDLCAYLCARSYPGRGILLGVLPDGTPAQAYFIMGRSENSRNRVFEATADGIRTRAFDESKMTDPSLVIYHPVRTAGETLIVTNGDQTDTIRDFLLAGKSFAEALRTRTFEPDPPNFTPRISGIVGADGGYALSILKAGDGDARKGRRFFYEYERPTPGTGHFLSTYEGFGTPLPSFAGEPVEAALPQKTAAELAAMLWGALDGNNRVSLWARVGAETAIINKHK
jgi:IMP cyclohydrolase